MEKDTQSGQSRPRTTPKDFFFYLAVIVCLYISTISFIGLLFNLIDISLPDRLSQGLSYAGDYSWGIKLAIASLIIIFPLFLLFSWLLRRDMRADGMKAALGIRKWLTSLTLFLAGLTLAIDLITLIVNFLNGEISTRFILKVLVVLVAAGAIFAYYLTDLRRGNASSSSVPKISPWIAGIAVFLALVGSFIIIGSPFTAREQAFDAERLSDLQNVQSEVITYWQEKSVLPKDLSALNDSISGYVAPTDPETGAPYQYSASSTPNLHFELCATFDLSSSQASLAGLSSAPYQVPSPASSPGYVPAATTDNWQHPAGQACFDRTIDPDLYPPFPNRRNK